MMETALTPAFSPEGRLTMIPTTVDDPAPRPSDRLHLLLAERGSAILPEAENGDGRVTLTDAMLAVAVLAGCFATFRASIGLGLAAFAVVLPALARTHVVMVRGRVVGSTSDARAWIFAFLSSTIRIGLILGLVAVIHATGVVVGGFVGSRVAYIYLDQSAGPWSAMARQGVIQACSWYGAVLGYVLLAIPLTLLALAYLIPRLLSVRDPI